MVVVGFLIKQIRGYFGPATSVEQGRYRVRTYSCFRGQIHRLSVRLRQVISPEKSIAQAIAAEDEIRPESKEAIDELHSLGVRVAMVWATGYNVVAIPVAAGLFVGYGFDLPMSVGAVAMSLSTIVVAINAQLLRRLRLRH